MSDIIKELHGLQEIDRPKAIRAARYRRYLLREILKLKEKVEEMDCELKRLDVKVSADMLRYKGEPIDLLVE